MSANFGNSVLRSLEIDLSWDSLEEIAISQADALLDLAIMLRKNVKTLKEAGKLDKAEYLTHAVINELEEIDSNIARLSEFLDYNE